MPGNLDLDPAERARRVDEVYRAFHDAVDALIAPRAAAGTTRAVVTIHSFTPVYRAIARPWHIGLLFADDDRLARMLETGLRPIRTWSSD